MLNQFNCLVYSLSLVVYCSNTQINSLYYHYQNLAPFPVFQLLPFFMPVNIYLKYLRRIERIKVDLRSSHINILQHIFTNVVGQFFPLYFSYKLSCKSVNKRSFLHYIVLCTIIVVDIDGQFWYFFATLEIVLLVGPCFTSC